ncbi:hypothetical protein [Pseudomonas sp. 91RF]|jgi:pimeloyl-ACP methyl ester carboxylesterase|uniref:hypothetical protein n=1 Tax=Pseudomonas sp. 91RF TaxID=2292261 RepID=UPI002114FE83|nr:hypothetical protein [Pseudomonas sp. 91RF]
MISPEKARTSITFRARCEDRVVRVQDYGFLFHKRSAYIGSQGTGAKGNVLPTQKLSINDLEVNVSIRGDGLPLLLINGLGGLIRAFDLLRKELSDYTTITLDVPGVGKSQMPLWPMRLPRHADTIARCLRNWVSTRLTYPA